MRTVSGARGPLNCHGQSSGPIRRYGGHAGAFDTDHLRTKLVLLLEGVGTGRETKCDRRKSLTGYKRNNESEV